MFTGAALLVGGLGVRADTTIQFGEEVPAPGTFQVSNKVTSVSLSTPFVCANVGTPGTYATNKINATFPGATPAKGNFLFGALSGGAQVPLSGLGAWTFTPSQGLVVTDSDPAMVCYSLNAAGERAPTDGVFINGFEQDYADASVSLRVVQLPDSSNGYVYKYYVDVVLPANPSPTASIAFAVRDGYDSSEFMGPGTTLAAYYCEAQPGDSDCPSGATHVYNNIEKLYTVAVGAQETHKRFIVWRPLKGPGMAQPSVAGATAVIPPKVIAAVFSITGMETRLDNNVSAGSDSLSDFDPTISMSDTEKGRLNSGLVEGGSLAGVTFTLSDDTTESAGALLSATATIDFNGTVVPAAVDCGSAAPNVGPGSTRTCTFSIDLAGSSFATDVNPGSYANGVHAGITLSATDPRGHTRTITQTLHVASADNDAPEFALSAVAAPDPQNNGMPTITCHMQSGATSPSCQGVFAQSFVTAMKPGPANAFDELASQRAIMILKATDSQNSNMYCSVDPGSANIFTFNGGPRLARDTAITSDFRLTYIVGAAGSATCTVVVVDGDSFPSGQAAVVTSKPFRIVTVND